MKMVKNVAKIKSDEQFCANCGRDVLPDEFLIENCQKCDEYCLASNKMCMQCLQSDTPGKDLLLNVV
ncbi:hypothetical protein DPMN_177457 [Dreissena polymorpha]|uniref:Uncharacterized protein n=1 Tax=Dreissena polymorpha TaxID=45954 RepID=A0A9D4IK76_DREPO|nr:hypothetical protein DPMN_177457 [Dreissena polymorpha]